MWWEFLFLLFLIKLMLVLFHRKIYDICWKRAWEGDLFIAFVAMAIGGLVTHYSFFGHHFEIIATLIAYASLYYWYIKKNNKCDIIVKPTHIVLAVLFVGFFFKVLYPTIYGLFI